MRDCIQRSIAIVLSIASLSATTIYAANEQNGYYLSVNYGFAGLRTQQSANEITLANIDDHFPLNYNKATQKNTFFNIGVGKEFTLSQALHMRLGSEYDQLTAKYSGTAQTISLPESTGSYTYNNDAQALLLSSTLLFTLPTNADVSFYIGAKAGVALTKISNFSYKSDTPDIINVNYTNQSRYNFAYGWNTGIEYRIVKQLSAHAGFEQLQLGDNPQLTNGKWKGVDEALQGNTANFVTGLVTVNMLTLGVNYFF